ncbi:hypothetical protein U27_01116 [Candidatus Vecturithrix granuli]|uniref:DUF1848 domain-containing protein n=1 Tax=Vecturithrix granuli TaxID=1499967 RepID=A0A081C9G2_VECG1|nr:hypothetical protein U27_01116 [Candidatus Vecturithrix granuli]
MIISASRRTDIPAFYAEWFMRRIRAGYCVTPNPFNRKQATSVSLKPEDVDVIVFWTRNPKPLLPFLPELDRRGFRYYVQYTLLNNPPELDPHTPRLESALRTFRELASQIGPQKVIWRYDPIVFSPKTDASFHWHSYREIAEALQDFTFRSVISLVDPYRKTQKRLEELARQGIEIQVYEGQPVSWFVDLMRSLARIAQDNGMEIVSCAEEIDLQPYGIRPGKCIDDEYIARVFGFEVTHQKDKSQRKACGCVESRDIGMYDTCIYGCRYCYATSNFERARSNLQQHDPLFPSLLKQ